MKIIKEASAVSPANNLVRLSKITVDPAQLDAYNAYLKEEIEASMRLEPGVLTLYATADKKQPNKITILEIYADREAYEKQPIYGRHCMTAATTVSLLLPAFRFP